MDAMDQNLKIEEHHYQVPGGKGYLHRIYQVSNGPTVLLVHGSLENGRIFYNDKGKGLAPYLARNGYDTFSMDWRGKGKSTPKVQKGQTYGQTECIRDDLLACMDMIRGLKPDQPLYVIGHSWGGVLVSSFLFRYPSYVNGIKAMVYFGTKRRILVKNLKRIVGIDLVWRGLGWLLCRWFGFFNARFIRLGVENDTTKFHRQITNWLKDKPWLDSDDGFNYGEKAFDLTLPPCLYLTGAADFYLGHPDDVKRFLDESGNHVHDFKILGKSTGFRHDFDHVDILTHRDAVDEVYPLVLNWFDQNS